MSSDPIRMLVVGVDTGKEGTLRDRLAGMQGVEGVGVAHNRRSC